MGNIECSDAAVACGCAQPTDEGEEIQIKELSMRQGSDYRRLREEFLERRNQGMSGRIKIYSTGSHKRKIDKHALAKSLSPDRDFTPNLIQYRGMR